MKKLNRISIMIFTLLLSTVVNAQQPVEMADSMRGDGKIYVVLAIILAILVGFMAYLFMLDRKITKLEKQIENLGSK